MKVAILFYERPEAPGQKSQTGGGRLASVFEAFASLGITAESIPYHDEVREAVKRQLLLADAVLVWVNPIEDGAARGLLDSLLREVASAGIYVSAHPEIINKLGNKTVLYYTRELGWGSDTYFYPTMECLKAELPTRLALGEMRVLKQLRGQSGEGIWQIQSIAPLRGESTQPLLRARHAKAGSADEVMPLESFFNRCEGYYAALEGKGGMVDQIYQPRIREGMVRCYLVGGKVEGFGRQEVVALHPPEATLSGADSSPAPTKRHYHSASMAEFQNLKMLLENEWVPGAQRLLDIKSSELPAIWDCDFFFGPKDSKGTDSYVLCEINVSCVSPFPESAALPLAIFVREQIVN
jgi:hypothetical protein